MYVLARRKMKLYGLDVILKTLKVFSLSMLFHACLCNLVLSREKVFYI